MKRRLLAVALALAGLVALAACSSSSDEPAGPASGDAVATTTVALPKSYRFAPEDIKVRVGDTVTWTNSDNFIHNVQLIGQDVTKDLPIGSSASVTFDRAGLVRYQCSLHPAQMKGSVLVEA
jgi:plastocyanin